MSADRSIRRRVLRSGLAAGSFFLPIPWAPLWAQSEGAVQLLRAPKVALVIGNAGYRHVNVLRNSGNDARAVAEALRGMGFEVTLVLDATRAEMVHAIDAYRAALAKRQAVGFFYFAGHGGQLHWRNYLLPVDANVQKPSEVASQCVDVDFLVRGLRDAVNPMNLIVLDACRNNPFGVEALMQQKGLSQMDAPLRTLLAYATAPGHEADDGPRAHGLYTESLLKEMKVPEARIEDVFKRVRLGVRRASGGRQVPWESTSLEEDFYFIPPERLKKSSEEEQEREFQEELSVFEGARQAKDAAPIEAYLRRYPSGRFAELAQLRLDQVLAAQGEKAVQPEPAAGNPFTVGSARADTKFRVGDRYTHNEIDQLPFAERVKQYTFVVTSITDEHVIFNDGEHIRDLLGNTVRFRDGRELTPRQDQPLEYAVGKSWSTHFAVSRAGKRLAQTTLEFRIVGRERHSVPAGTFDCFRIEMRGVSRSQEKPPTEITMTRWDAPGQVRIAVARNETWRQVIRGHVTKTRQERVELVSFQQQA